MRFASLFACSVLSLASITVAQSGSYGESIGSNEVSRKVTRSRISSRVMSSSNISNAQSSTGSYGGSIDRARSRTVERGQLAAESRVSRREQVRVKIITNRAKVKGRASGKVTLNAHAHRDFATGKLAIAGDLRLDTVRAVNEHYPEMRIETFKNGELVSTLKVDVNFFDGRYGFHTGIREEYIKFWLMPSDVTSIINADHALLIAGDLVVPVDPNRLIAFAKRLPRGEYEIRHGALRSVKEAY